MKEVETENEHMKFKGYRMKHASFIMGLGGNEMSLIVPV